MTLKSILEKTVSFLGITVDITQTGDEQTLLITCAKDLLMRLTGEMTDVRKRKEVIAENGVIPYSDVDEEYKRALRLTKGGRKKTFLETSTGLIVEEDGTYELTYAYFARPAALTQTVDLPPKFSVNVLALGTAGEYCYRKGLYKECETYDERFTSALNNLLATAKSITVKAVGE